MDGAQEVSLPLPYQKHLRILDTSMVNEIPVSSRLYKEIGKISIHET
jgi:hypothetical protein